MKTHLLRLSLALTLACALTGSYNARANSRNDSDDSSGCTGSNPIQPDNGSAHHSVLDFELFGSVGNMPLRLVRSCRTRAPLQSQNFGRFGPDSPWTHNFQWLIRDAGLNYEGEAVIRIDFPTGGTIDFARDPQDPTPWLPPARDKWSLQQSGNDFTLTRADASQYKFKKLTAQGMVYYRMESVDDGLGNVYVFGYASDQDVILRRVTDPSGRWLAFYYTDVGFIGQRRVQLAMGRPLETFGQWHELPVSSTSSNRYLVLAPNVFQGSAQKPTGEL